MFLHEVASFSAVFEIGALGIAGAGLTHYRRIAAIVPAAGLVAWFERHASDSEIRVRPPRDSPACAGRSGTHHGGPSGPTLLCRCCNCSIACDCWGDIPGCAAHGAPTAHLGVLHPTQVVFSMSSPVGVDLAP